VNGYIPLIGPSDLVNKPQFAKGFGEIYVQAQFARDGYPADSSEPEVKENIADLIKRDQEMVSGNLTINVIHGRNIYPVSTTIKPYCEIHFKGKKIFTTDTKQKTNNPIWKATHSQVIKLTRGELVLSIRSNIKDFRLDKILNSSYTTLNLEGIRSSALFRFLSLTYSEHRVPYLLLYRNNISLV